MIEVTVKVYVDTQDPEVALAVVNDYFQFGDPIRPREAVHHIYGWEVQQDDPFEIGLIRIHRIQ